MRVMDCQKRPARNGRSTCTGLSNTCRGIMIPKANKEYHPHNPPGVLFTAEGGLAGSPSSAAAAICGSFRLAEHTVLVSSLSESHADAGPSSPVVFTIRPRALDALSGSHGLQFTATLAELQLYVGPGLPMPVSPSSDAERRSAGFAKEGENALDTL